MLFRKIVRNLIRWACSDGEDAVKLVKSSRIGECSDPYSNLRHNETGVNFTLYNANGGKVILIQRYDERQDRHYSEMYIIPDGDNFGSELELIITKNSLSK